MCEKINHRLSVSSQDTSSLKTNDTCMETNFLKNFFCMFYLKIFFLKLQTALGNAFTHLTYKPTKKRITISLMRPQPASQLLTVLFELLTSTGVEKLIRR